MLSKYNTNKAGYFYRILALPVVLFFVAAFTIKTKAGIEKLVNPAKKITVIIDAGHGGNDFGAKALDGSHEKDINLAFIKRIKDLNQSSNIELVFTRETDIFQSPQEKAAIANKNGADLFISVHASSGPFATATKNGMEIYVSKDENLNSNASKLFASSVIAHFKNNYGIAVAPLPLQRNPGIFVLQANDCPSIIIETGFISNKQDLDYLQSSKAKDDFAKNLLQAIAQYADNFKSQVYETNTLSSKEDTVPSAKNKLGLYKGEEIKNITVSKDCEVVTIKTVSGKTITMSMNEAKKQHIVLPPPPPPLPPPPPPPPLPPIPPPPPPNKPSHLEDFRDTDASERVVIVNGQKIENNTTPSTSTRFFIEKSQPVYFVDGKEISAKQMKELDPNCIESLTLLKGESAVALYGKNKSVNGIIEIKTKGSAIYKKDSDNGITSVKIRKDDVPLQDDMEKAATKDMTFTKVEQEPQFPGGKDEWLKYLRSSLNANTPVDNGASEGTYTVVVRFIVSKDGTISDVVAETKHGYGMEDEAIRIIKNGPNWTPGMQNDKIVKTYKKQPITFVITEQ